MFLSIYIVILLLEKIERSSLEQVSIYSKGLSNQWKK